MSSSSSYLSSPGYVYRSRLHSALNRYYSADTLRMTAAERHTNSRPHSLPRPPRTTRSTTSTTLTAGSVCEAGWVLVEHECELEESDAEFAERIVRESLQEDEREAEMLDLQMTLWRRWGLPRFEEY